MSSGQWDDARCEDCSHCGYLIEVADNGHVCKRGKNCPWHGQRVKYHGYPLPRSRHAGGPAPYQYCEWGVEPPLTGAT